MACDLVYVDKKTEQNVKKLDHAMLVKVSL